MTITSDHPAPVESDAKAAPAAPHWLIAAADLREALSRVAHAAADDEARPILAAILIEARGDGIRLVAADNYRIAQLQLHVEVSGDWRPAVLPIADLPTIQAFLKARQKGTAVRVERLADDRLRISGPFDAARSRGSGAPRSASRSIRHTWPTSRRA